MSHVPMATTPRLEKLSRHRWNASRSQRGCKYGLRGGPAAAVRADQQLITGAQLGGASVRRYGQTHTRRR